MNRVVRWNPWVVAMVAIAALCAAVAPAGAQPSPPLPTCDISVTPNIGSFMVAANTPFDMCGPTGVGLHYHWFNAANVQINSDETNPCVHIDGLAPGTYDFELVDFQTLLPGEPYMKCPVEIVVPQPPPGTNCPRTPGFWTQQCAQKDNGSTKYNVPQMTSITQKVDALSAFFNWGGSSFSSFCAIENPPRPMDQRKQAKRQFACLLADVAAGELNLITLNGETVTLDPNTPISCGGLTATTIGDLITEVDALLAADEGKDLSGQVLTDYTNIVTCCDGINNGQGIGSLCLLLARAQVVPDNFSGSDDVEMYRATPNPTSSSTEVAFAVKDGGENVDIGVYDISGRLMKKLASGFQAAGRYTVTWDGYGSNGTRARSGVYFVRGTVGGRAVLSRIMLLH